MNSAQYVRVMIVAVVVLVVCGCTYVRPLVSPMQQQYYISGNQPSTNLLILLPGIHDDPVMFESQGFIDSIRQSGQPCDLVSVDAHYGYYNAGIFVDRLHEDVVIPAKRAGYSNIKIVGVSLGGYGALLYANSYPSDITTLVLLAPWLGDEELIESISAVGGLEFWQPGDTGNEKLAQGIWLQRKEHLSSATDNVELYLGYGSKDKFQKAHSLFASTIPDDHVFDITGGHNWSTWQKIWKKIQVEKILCSS